MHLIPLWLKAPPWAVVLFVFAAIGRGFSAEADHVIAFRLTDQFGQTNRFDFPRSRPLLLLVGDRSGSEQVDPWVGPLKEEWGGKADLAGIADVSAAPWFLRSRIQEGIRKQRSRSLLLDFEGKVTKPLRCVARTANLFVVDRDGRILARLTGLPDEAKLRSVRAALESVNAGNPPP